MNATSSAKAAGYACKTIEAFNTVGSQNISKLKDRINFWLDEEGLSERRLKAKLLSLIGAKKTKFTKLKGKFEDGSAPEGVTILAETKKMAWSGKGENAEPIDDGDTLVAVETESLETQRRSLDMAFKMKGLYAPAEVNVTGLEDLARVMEAANSRVPEEDD